jgi:hypothetical protein
VGTTSECQEVGAQHSHASVRLLRNGLSMYVRLKLGLPIYLSWVTFQELTCHVILVT